MVRKIIEKNIDIYYYPQEFEGNSGSITIGDLHGNAIKLLHFLLRHKIIKFKTNLADSIENYQKFVTLYEQSGDITRQYTEIYTNRFDRNAINSALQSERGILPGIIKEFNQLISQLEVVDKSVLIRLIGDEVADRGSNDYFTLRLLMFLHENAIKTIILISNHNCEFISAYEHLLKHKSFDSRGGINSFQKQSLFGLQLLLEEKIISDTDITALVNESYKPTLKILDYTLGKEGICLFTHAPIRFDIIRIIAHHLDVIYDDETKESLGTTIDQINAKFKKIVDANEVHNWCNTKGIAQVDQMSAEDIIKKPLVYIIWNRWNEHIDTLKARPLYINNYNICYVHGHDPYQSPYAHIINLDTLCGKQARKEMQSGNRYLARMNCYKVLDSDEQGLGTVKQ